MILQPIPSTSTTAQIREVRKHTRAAVKEQQEIIRTTISPRARPRPSFSPRRTSDRKQQSAMRSAEMC
jgi:hypothetical protein